MLRPMLSLAIGIAAVLSCLAADVPERRITLFFTGMVQGAFEPCG